MAWINVSKGYPNASEHFEQLYRSIAPFAEGRSGAGLDPPSITVKRDPVGGPAKAALRIVYSGGNQLQVVIVKVVHSNLIRGCTPSTRC